jgi:hypothetical protein
MNMSTSQARVVDPILTNHSRGYKQTGLIGDRLLPIATMPTRAAKRIEFGREAFRRYQIRRAPGGGISQVSFGYEGKPVQLSQYALAAKTPVEHMDEALEVPGIDLLTMGVDTVFAVIALEREIQQATAARNPATYGNNNKLALVGAAKWSDDASDPGKAVEDAQEQIRGRTGRRANKLSLGARVAAKLRHHGKIVQRFQHTNSDRVSDAMLAQYFGVEEVLVGNAIVDDGDGNSSDVWGNDAILAFVPPEGQANINIPAFGYTYRLANHPFVQPARWVGDYRSWMNDCFDEWSPEVVGPDAGFLFQAAV